jgi:SAM-dependent methyltransferase
MLRLLEDAGYECHGIEVSPFAAGFARDQGHSVLCGDVLELEIPADNYDIVIALEVVEHLVDPMSFFRKVHHVLRSNGLFFYTTGNFQYFSMQRLLFGSSTADPYLIPEEHLYFFGSAQLREYFRRCGFGRVAVPSLPFIKESVLLTRLLRATHITRTTDYSQMSGIIRLLYNGLVRIADPIYRPPLPLAWK